MNEKPATEYRNTDLDLVCDVDPAILASEFEARGLRAHVTPGDDGRYYVACEGCNDTEPEPNIIRLLDAIDALSDSARKLWAHCSKRQFDIGYDCGDDFLSHGISRDTLRRLGHCGASLRITLYPYSPDD